MAFRYLLAWEFGAGLGHVSPMAEIARRLKDRGHEVHMVSADNYSAAKAFGGFEVPVYALPSFHKPRKPFRSTRSIAEVLYNLGYHSSATLAVKLAAWRDLIDLVRPDVMIANYAPTAVLASRDRPTRVLQFGTGFALPPPSVPVPGFSLLGAVTNERLQAAESGVTGKINRALNRVRMPEISEFREAFMTDRDVLVTWRELDHYPNRPEGVYSGPLFNATFQQPPTWPKAPNGAPRVFCYLKAGDKGFGRMMEVLKAIDARVLLYASGLGASDRQSLATERLQILSQPVDLRRACDEADLVICHGGHGTVAMALLAGTKLLLMPQKSHAEQWMNANNVVRLGAGVVVPDKAREPEIRDALERIMGLEDRPQAQAFRRRYAGFDPESTWQSLIGAAEQIAKE